MTEDELITQSREIETQRRYAVQDAKERYRQTGVPERHNKVITPKMDPSRFTADEKAVFDKGLCGWIIESGTINGIVYCGKPSKPGATFGLCEAHEAELLEDYYPDGGRRNT